jgi:hypothetical protein
MNSAFNFRLVRVRNVLFWIIESRVYSVYPCVLPCYSHQMPPVISLRKKRFVEFSVCQEWRETRAGHRDAVGGLRRVREVAGGRQ